MKNILNIIKKYPKKKVISLCLAVLLVVLLAVLPMTTSGKGGSDEYRASILSGTVEKGEISSVLIGAGTLSQEASADINIPSTVKLTKFLVSNGDRVKKGDALASVDRVTLMQTISEVQETMDYLAKKMEEAKDSSTTDKVIAQTAGTVKNIYAEDGDDVQSVMLKHGALAVLSLDGLMAVDLKTEKKLVSGETVTLSLKDGSEINGQVKSVLDGTAKIVFEDNGYAVGTKATVKKEDGTKVGSGKIYINSQWNATAYSGTVSAVKVIEKEKVLTGEALFSLKNVSSRAKYDSLAEQHREYEELMLSLFEMYQTETLNAPEDGIVSGIDKESALLLSAGDKTEIEFLANSPDGNNETVYNNYIGKVISVNDGTWNLKLNPENQSVTDYKNLLSVYFGEDKMTQEVSFNSSVPIYELSKGDWKTVEKNSINEGDVLLFASSSAADIVWLVRIIKGEPDISKPDGEETTTVPADDENTTKAPESDNTTKPSDTETTKPPKGESTTKPNIDITIPSLDDITIPSGEDITIPSLDDITIPSQEDITKPSAEDDKTEPTKEDSTKPSKEDSTKPSKGETSTKPSVDITIPSLDDITIPSLDDITIPSLDDITIPSGEDITMPSGEDITMPSGGDITMPSGGDITMPSGGDITMPSGGDITIPSGGDITMPSGEDITMPSGEDITMPSLGDITMPSGGDFTIPSQQSGQSGIQLPDGFTAGSFGGLMGVPGGTNEQKPEFELFDLSGETVLHVTPQDKMTVFVTVDELDISKIEIGQNAEITLDAFLGESFEGKITNIGTIGKNSGGNSKFSVEITMDRGENMLSGMNATAKIVLSSKKDVLMVPVEALCENGSETVIYTKYNKGKEILEKPVTVTVGTSDGINAEIISGLEDGQEYYYSYYDTYQSSENDGRGFGGFGGW